MLNHTPTSVSATAWTGIYTLRLFKPLSPSHRGLKADSMNVEVYPLSEELDSFNHQQVQDDILAILEKGCNPVIDMAACNYVSSTGLRVLLYSKKMAASKGLKLYLVGISDEVKDVMKATGFNSFFIIFSTMEECLKEVKSE